MLTRAQPVAASTHSYHGVARDARLDFWRALCLIDMVLVHLVYEGVNFGPLQRTLGEYTRFAAGGFVFVAGLSIGAIFLPRTSRPGGKRSVSLSLWRRSFYILCIHYAATLSFVSLDLLRGVRTEVPHILPLLRDILLLREGGDLLPLYVILLAASPAMLWMLRQRSMPWLLALVSVGLFALGHRFESTLRFPMSQNFPAILWQLMFVAGLLFGAGLARYSALTRRTKLALSVSAFAASVLLWAGDYRSDFGWTWPSLPLVFCKNPLSAGEALRYLGLIFTIVFSTDLMWDRLRTSRFVNLISPIGRRSLGCYVAHTWIVALLGMVAFAMTRAGAWQMLLAVPALVAVWSVAVALEWNDRRFGARSSSSAKGLSSRWMPVPISAGAAVAIFLGIGLVMERRALPPPPNGAQAIVTPDGDNVDPNNADPFVAPSFDQPDSADMMPV